MRRSDRFGRKPKAIAVTVDDRGLLDHLDRVGLGSAFGLSAFVLAVLFLANWWTG